MRLLIALLFLPAFASCDGCWDQTAYAGGCYQQLVQPYYAKAVVQPVYQYQYYFVGASVRAAAIVEAEKQSDPDYAAFLQFKQFRGEFEAFRKYQEQQSAVPHGALPQRQSLIEQRCVRCHNPNSPNGPGGGYDFSGPLTPDDLKAIKAILPTGKMPKVGSPEAKDFSNELAGQLILEAIDLLDDRPSLEVKQPAEPQPPAEPLDHVPPPPPLPPTEQ